MSADPARGKTLRLNCRLLVNGRCQRTSRRKRATSNSAGETPSLTLELVATYIGNRHGRKPAVGARSKTKFIG
jgi:hypothetical protein